MASKLKDLKITKVDFVDAGANQQADVLLFKSKEGAPPAAQEPAQPEHQSVLKRFLASVMSVAKREGIEQTEIEAIAKGCDAETFDEKYKSAQLRKTTDEIWDFCYFLQDSLCSIVRDNDVAVTEKGTMMSQSLAEFSTAVTAAIALWSSGTPTKVLKKEHEMTAEQVDIAKAKLAELIEKSSCGDKKPVKDEGNQKPTNTKTKKGVEEDMKFDKSKLTPEELTSLEAIVKKAGIQDEPANTDPTATDPVAKAAPAATEPAAPAAAPASEPAGEDIYKGLHPAVAAELKELRKRADAAEDHELQTIAKKYEILGKKPEELAKTLKTLKSAGGTAYDDMIGVLDQSLSTVEKSGAFSEVGKSGNGTGAEPWSQIEKHAETIQKSVPTLTWNQAIEKACEQHPELVAEYENNR